MNGRRITQAVAVFIGLGPLPLPVHGQGGAGYRLQVSVHTRTTVSSSGQSRSSSTMDRHVVRIRNGVARVDLGGGTAGGGSYMLLEAKTGMMRLVDPSLHEVSELPDVESVAENMNASDVRVTDTASSVRDLGPGERIMGFATRRLRFRLRYTVRTQVAGTAMSLRIVSESDLHVSDSVAALDPAFGAFESRFLRSAVDDTRGAFASATLRALLQGRPRGVALRSVAVHRIAMSGGDSTVTRITRRVTALERSGVSPAAMVVPDGYARDAEWQSKRGVDEASRAPLRRPRKAP